MRLTYVVAVVYAVIYSSGNHCQMVECTDIYAYEESDKVAVVPEAHAIVDPGTMVICNVDSSSFIIVNNSILTHAKNTSYHEDVSHV